MSIPNEPFLDTVKCKLPKKVQDEISDIWANNALGNDVYIFRFVLVDHEETYPIVAEFLRKNGITDYCYIRNWW